MKTRVALGIVLAVLFHLGLILFGGIFFFTDKEKQARAEELEETIDIADEPEPEKPEEPEEKKEEEEKVEEPPAPQFVNSSMPDENPGPALAPMSLSDLEGALAGLGGEGGFGGGGGGLSSGGMIGGSGSGSGSGDEGGVLSASQLDQKPRLVVRVDPKPPQTMVKSLPQVSVLVFIDANGQVLRAEVTPKVDPASEKAILDAVQRWKYEPGMRDGKKVACKVSHKINFSNT